MSDPHDPHRPGPGLYRAANHRRRALAIAAGAGLILLTLVAWSVSGDDEPPAAAPAPVASAPAVAEESAVPEESVTPEETAPTATSSPSPARPVKPAELVTRLMAVVEALEDSDELDDDGADELHRRLEQLAERLDRDPKKAAGKLQEFLKKLADLRKDDEISETGFSALTAGAAQIAQALPAGR